MVARHFQFWMSHVWFSSLPLMSSIVVVRSNLSTWASDGASQPWDLGDCYRGAVHGEPMPGMGDRSHITIRLLERDWLSHKLSTHVAAIMLREFYRYNVEIVRVDSDLYQEMWHDFVMKSSEDAFPSNWPGFLWDIDMENWRAKNKEQEPRLVNAVDRAANKNALEVLGSVGYTGRSGLYILPEALQALPFADYYKSYMEAGQARAAGFEGFNPDDTRHALASTSSSVCSSTLFHWCESSGDYEGYWIPSWCRANISSCIEVWMGPISWDEAYFEQLVANSPSPLKIIFAYHSSEALAKRRYELSLQPKNVVFFSFTPNWGADERGSVRISFVDGDNVCQVASVPTVDGDLNCDYPEVALTKLASVDLRNTPEGIAFLRKLTLSREDIHSLLRNVTAISTRQEVFQASCDFVKSDVRLNQRLLEENGWSCVLESEHVGGYTFHPVMGRCRPAAQYHTSKCFDTPQGTEDRSGVRIRIASGKWFSHDIMKITNAILLHEYLGYTVTFEDADYKFWPGPDWGRLFEDGVVDFEPESWFASNSDPTLQEFVVEKGITLPPLPNGWEGRTAMFVSPASVEKIAFSTYYRFYEGSRARDAGFHIRNSSSPVEKYAEGNLCTGPNHTRPMPWCYSDDPDLMDTYVPPLCVEHPEICIEAPFMIPQYDEGKQPQLVRNFNLSIILKFYGYDGWSYALQSIVGSGTPVVFYGFTPDPGLTRLGSSNQACRVEFPDWMQGCDDNPSTTDVGPKRCDFIPTTLRKIIRKSLQTTAPEATYALINFEMTNPQIESVMAQSQDGGGAMTVFEACCWFVKNYPETVNKAVPSCISRPKAKEDIQMGDLVWSPLNARCINMSCPANSSKSFTPIAGGDGIWEPGCVACRQQSVGFVPSSDQLSCVPCAPGKAANKHGDSCEDCPPGKYASIVGADSCSECPPGRYNPLPSAQTCTLCPTGANCTSSGVAIFTAQSEYYIMGTLEQVRGKFQSWKDSDYNADIPRGFNGTGPFKCPVPSSCRGNNLCLMSEDGEPRMIGEYCGTCAAGFYRNSPYDLCSQCPDSVQSWLLLIAVFLAFAVNVFIVDRVYAYNAGNLRQTNTVVFKVSCNFLILMSVKAEIIGLNELVANFGKRNALAFVISLPMKALLAIGDILRNPARSVAAVPCLLNPSDGNSLQYEHFQVLLGWFLVPLVVGLCALFIVSCRFFVKFDVNVTMTAAVVVLMFFLQPMVTSLFLSSYQCEEWDLYTHLKYDERRLAMSMAVACDGDEHQAWMWVSTAGIVCWSFGIPLAYWILLRSISKSTTMPLQHPLSSRKYGFLYDGFETDSYYQENLNMVRKTLYLLAASFSYFPGAFRTLVLLGMGFIFLGLHLSYAPYDNRAYFGLDKLETWSGVTMLIVLIGKVLQTTAENMYDPPFKGYPEIWYLPGFISFVWLLLQALYLTFRNLFWPIDEESSLVPEFIKNRVGCRMRVTLLTSEDDEDGLHEHHEHACLKLMTPVRINRSLILNSEMLSFLPSRERELFKTLFAEALEVLLRRHELALGDAPDALYIPTFCIQIERLLVVCMCWALKERVIQQLKKKSDGEESSIMGPRRSLGDKARAMLQSTAKGRWTLNFDEDVDWTNCEDPNLRRMREVLSAPVNCEELHIALMNITPRLLIAREDASVDPLKEFMDRNRGVMDGWCDISWLFDADGHRERVDLFSHDQGDDTEVVDAAEKARAGLEELPMAEVWEDHIDFDFDLDVQSDSAQSPSKLEFAPAERPAGSSETVVDRSMGHWSAIYDLYQLQCQEQDNAQIVEAAGRA